MKIISWNTRGLGGLEKRQEVRKLVGNLKPFIMCIQETKMQTFDDFLVTSLWGNSPYAFSYRPSVGASGGLMTIWDASEVDVWSTESREHVLWCHGRIIKTGEEFYVANVYAPCDDRGKQSSDINVGGRMVCVCGDFNAVKTVDERHSARGGQRFMDHISFNRFIEDNNLIDLPLSGSKFTWFKGDGFSMSRLDRFLLSEEWCMAWPNCKQVASLRGLSDHCPLVLSANEEDWGPRPMRMLKCWKDVPGYDLFVREKWVSFQVEGWGGRIDSLKDRLSALDQKGEEEVLFEAELAELHGVTLDIHSLARRNASISWQQSRSLWLKEGDANSKYFHSVLAGRRRRNAISVIQVDGVSMEGVTPIRQAVYT
ncbi:endonuclease/exonuclease/phosphatase family protein, partial [Trifolium medium]|nr:endonuclease/exonuclease/phosphatase family protein [Trifolium medium]